MIDEQCSTCRFWLRDDHTLEKGRCRRGPLTVEKRSDEWCGEWKPWATGNAKMAERDYKHWMWAPPRRSHDSASVKFRWITIGYGWHSMILQCQLRSQNGEWEPWTNTPAQMHKDHGLNWQRFSDATASAHDA